MLEQRVVDSYGSHLNVCIFQDLLSCKKVAAAENGAVPCRSKSFRVCVFV